MSWMETNAEMERMKFILALQEAEDEDSGETFTDVCRRFEISRQTGYKWRERFEKGGAAALANRPPVARRHPNATKEETEALIVALRKERPTWGPKKLKKVLETKHGRRFPAASTIGDILTRRGLVTPKKRRLRVPPQGVATSEYTGPNAVWCIDHKGHFPLTDGNRCGPLTLMDGFSRFLFRCEAVEAGGVRHTLPHVESAFREYGLPQAMRSDGGSPFAHPKSPGRLSRLSIWWLKLGIELHRNDPGSPQQNGRLERFHRTLQEETINSGPHSRAVQQRLFDTFRYDYNAYRPHEALGQRTPRAVYVESWRTFPGTLTPPEYPDDRLVRRVQPGGHVSFMGHRVRVGKALAGEPVYLQPVRDDLWDAYYARHYLLSLERRRDELRVVQRPPSPHDHDRRPPSVQFCA